MKLTKETYTTLRSKISDPIDLAEGIFMHEGRTNLPSQLFHKLYTVWCTSVLRESVFNKSVKVMKKYDEKFAYNNKK